MGDVKGEDPFEHLPEKRGDQSGENSGFGVDFDFGYEFVDGEKNQERQGEGQQILQKKVVDEGYEIGIYMIGDEGAFCKRPVEGCPDGGDEERGQEDDADDEHDEIFHQTVVEEGFLIVGFENEIDGVDQVGKQKTGADEGTDQAEPSQIGEMKGDILHLLKKCGIESDKKFI